MIIDIRHTGIVIKDLKESIAFYQQLGFAIQSWIIEPKKFIDKISDNAIDELVTVKMISPSGDMIELLDYGESADPIQRSLFDTGVAHIAFTVNDIDAVYKQLIETGIVFLSEPQPSPNGYAKVVFCKSPEESFIELVEVLE